MSPDISRTGLDRRRFMQLALGGAALGAVGATSACGGGTGAGTTGAAAFDVKAEPTGSLTMRWWGGDARNNAYLEALKVFQTKVPKVKVATQYSGSKGYWDKLNTEMAGGAPPDLIQMDTKRTSTYVKRGQLMPLDDFIPDVIQYETLYPTVRNVATVGGKRYGVSSGMGHSPVTYDKTRLEGYGLTVPDNNWTWDDFFALCAEATKAQGKGKFGCLDGSWEFEANFQIWLRQRKYPGAFTEDGKLTFTKDDLKAWWSLWEEKRKAGIISDAETTQVAVNETGPHPLVAGTVVLTFGSGLRPRLGSLTKNVLAEAIIPRGSDKVTGQYLNGGVLLSIPTKSKNPVAAAHIINFFLNDEEAIKIMKVTRGVPNSDKATSVLDPLLTDSDKQDVEFAKIVTKCVEEDKLPSVPVVPPGAGETIDTFKELALEVAYGKSAIAEAADTFFSEAEKNLGTA